MNRPARITTLLSIATAALALSACATGSAPPMADPLPPAATRCNADAARMLVGETATAQNVDLARQRAGAEIARVLRPGQVVTMEYREGRLNVHVDAQDVITRLACG